MIEVKNLVKRYGPILAVDNVSFTVKKGEVLAFLGPNGAGKSTTIKVISGFLHPTSGSIKINGLDLNENSTQIKATIGYMPESTPAYPEMTVFEYLTFIATAYELSDIKDKVNNIIETTNLSSVKNQLVETLSKGFRSRLSFAAAIIHEPDILLLDEPTDGLDPNQKNELRNLIKTLSKNKAIIISTHILEEVGAMCNRVIIISEGKVVLDGKPNDLQEKTSNNNKIMLNIDEKNKEQVESALSTTLNEFSVSNSKDKVLYMVNKKEDINEVISLLNGSQIPFHEIYRYKAPLDGAFRSLTKSKE